MRSVAVVLLTLFIVAEASACGVCTPFTGKGLTLPHPRAIEIAVATRLAIDANRLPKVASVSRGWNDRPDSTSGAGMVQAWSEKWSGRSGSRRGAFAVHVVFIDTSEMCGLQVRGARAIFEVRPTGSADVVLVTTRIAWRALRQGSVRQDDAVRDGYLVIEGDRRLADRLFP